ncbi:phosphate signaling complex PhoU family protein [Streptomyces griseorubiginosus]|uniref:phosphate signaling complex PhoU family protein n=1 Tax=Streptomyces griseorubiginosus TaxID=67304 RepID=UPI0027E23F48|nr:PhoU domain-containing protein [Streptomyces griseorubiginosus]
MRTGCARRKELESIGQSLVETANLVGSAMGRATGALLDADLQQAQSVTSTEEQVEALQRELEERDRGAGPSSVARHGPAVTSLRMSADLERCGVLAQHVATAARRRHPQHAVPDDLRRTLLEMGQLAQRLMAQAAEVLITQGIEAARQLEQDDGPMDELHRMISHHLMDLAASSRSRSPTAGTSPTSRPPRTPPATAQPATAWDRMHPRLTHRGPWLNHSARYRKGPIGAGAKT